MLAVANRHKFKINLNSVVRSAGFYNCLKEIVANLTSRLKNKMSKRLAVAGDYQMAAGPFCIYAGAAWNACELSVAVDFCRKKADVGKGD